MSLLLRSSYLVVVWLNFWRFPICYWNVIVVLVLITYFYRTRYEISAWILSLKLRNNGITSDFEPNKCKLACHRHETIKNMVEELLVSSNLNPKTCQLIKKSTCLSKWIQKHIKMAFLFNPFCESGKFRTGNLISAFYFKNDLFQK